MDKISLNSLGTYKEIAYLKRSLGPVLVSALAELCVKRPTDPIEFLGHWLLRWRYNEELKRRDMENALEVIRQRQTAKCERESQMMADCKLPMDMYGQGVIPDFPYLPPGYGGPVNPDELEVKDEVEEEEEEEEEEPEWEGEYEMPPPNYAQAMHSIELPGEGDYYDDPQLANYDPNDPAQYNQNWDQGQEEEQPAVGELSEIGNY